MIGKPEWFTYRIFGWGVRPRTWQGWAYVAAIAAIMGFIAFLPVTNSIHMWCFGILVGMVVLDVIHIMTRLDKEHDEREKLQQMIIERNCSFAAVAILSAIAVFQAFKNRHLTGLQIDSSILIVIGVMTVVKIVSTWHIRRKL
jgi:branched-subunit amino acid transport protein